MRRLLAALLFVLETALSQGVANAQMLQAIVNSKAVAAGPYVGIVDLVANPTAIFSLRAASAAIATTGTQSIVDLRRTSDNATCTATIAASGGALDLTVKTPCGGQSVTAWATRGTFSGTIAGTSLATSGDACTAIAGDAITGAGITSYTTIASVTSCAVGVGHYVLSQPWTISVAETMTDMIAIAVSQWYDQSARVGCDGVPCDLVQATAGSQPFLILSGCITASGSCVYSTGAQSLVSADAYTPDTSLSLGGVAERISTTGACIFGGAPNVNKIVGVSASANLWTLAGATNSLNFTASDAAAHAVNAVIDGASTVVNVDGTETTGTTTLSTNTNNPRYGGVAAKTCLVAEFYFYNAVDFSSGNRSALQANQKAWFGTP